MKYIKLLIIFSFIFIVLYLEPVTLQNNIKFSHLWKTFFIFILVLLIFLKLPFIRAHSIQINRPHTLQYGYYYALYPLVMCLFISNPFDGVFLSFQRLFFILFIQYLLINPATQVQLVRFLLYCIVFVTFSTVPFALNLLQPLGKSYDMIGLLAAKKNGFVGIFQNPHSASLMLSICALLAFLFFFQEKNKTRKIAFISLSIYLTFFMFMTYVRTGIAVLLVGLLVFGIISKQIKKFGFFVMFVSAIILFIIFNYMDTDILMNRLLGRTIYTKDTTYDLNSMSSGRLSFVTSALKIYVDSSPQEWLLGLGQTEMGNRMYNEIGWAIFAHNGYVNELIINGLIGLILLLFFLRSIFLDIKQIKENQIRNMGFSLYAGFLIFIFFQGGEFPLQYLLFAPFILHAHAVIKETKFKSRNS